MKLGVPWSHKEKGPQGAVPHNIAESSSVHERLDDLTRQLERLARITEGRFSQDDSRSSRTVPDKALAEPAFEPAPRIESRPQQPADDHPGDSAVIERYAGRRKLNRSPLKPTYARSGGGGGQALEQTIADITARQRSLDEDRRTAPAAWQRAIDDDSWTPPLRRRDVAEDDWPPRSRRRDGAEDDQIPSLARPRRSPVRAAVPPAQDLSGLERQLRDITEKIEALRRPCAAEDSVPAMRQELSDISRSLAEAMPQRAIEALETEIRGLADRLDQTRQSGADASALANVENALADVREALHALTPAESLSGFQSTIEGLAQKIDQITASHQDPVVLQHLESAITGLRSIVSHVATDDALGRLADEVRGLAAKVERTADSAAAPDALKGLEKRVGAMAQAMEETNAQGRNVPAQVESVVRGLAEKIEQLQLGRGESIAFGQLEDRIARLVEQIDASGAGLKHLDAVERGLADVLVHLEEQRSRAFAAAPTPSAVDPAVESLKRDMEAVNNTLSRVVDRLATIETGLRSGGRERSSAPPAAPATGAAAAATASTTAPPPKPPKPAPKPPPASKQPATGPAAPATQAPTAQPAAGAPSAQPSPPARSNAGLSERLAAAAAAQGRPASGSGRAPIDPDLPPDHPIEPGAARGRASASAAERIAASEAVLGAAKPSADADPGDKTSFIAAARRAARTAARSSPDSDQAGAAGTKPSLRQRLTGRVRSLLVGTGIVLVTLGAFRIAVMLVGPSTPVRPERSHVAQATGKPRPDRLGAHRGEPTHTASIPKTKPASDRPRPAQPQHTAGPQSSLSAPATTPAVISPWNTGSLPPSVGATGSIASTAASSGADGEPRPSGRPAGEPNDLMAAARAGNPAAEYQLADRELTGQGVARNPDQAAKWLQRAAKQGLAPAQFRLGTLYEKGVGVKKDLKTAEHLYKAAAEQGNAKAMHNLAVLYSEGVDGKPDYKTAAKWFRKAADRGIIDSQYNLAVLSARGIGIPRNLAEAYKWFALAALKGDRQSARKRDEIAAKLDAKSLRAAKLAVKSWTVVPQPKTATTIETPPGGWGELATKPKAKAQIQHRRAPQHRQHATQRSSIRHPRAGKPLQIGPG